MHFTSIKWINNNPYSIDFNDIYFYENDGLKETEHVFINHNQLSERFGKLRQKTFTIIETGFGTGLNFFCVALRWLALAPVNANLRYVSIERYPLDPDDISRIMQSYPQFTEISAEFLQQYANLKPNLNIFNIAENRIQIALWAGDILDVMPKIDDEADAWFLDGFAPAKNPEMWSSDVFEHVARLSKKDTTFATYTSAGNVRRGLQASGFKVQKVAGFGKKREMLCGIYTGKLK